MKVAVVGAGGVGGYFGGLLAAGGVETWFLTRGVHLGVMSRSGLRIRSTAGDFDVPPGRMTDRAGEIGTADVVLFCVKGYDTAEAAAAMSPLVGDHTVVINLQNGVGKEERLARLLRRGTVYGGVAFLYATVTAPGVITETGGLRRLLFGPLHGDPAGDAQARAILTVMTGAGLPAVLTPDIGMEIWKKFVFISTVGGLTALTGLTIGEILAAPELASLLRDAMEEAAAVAAACGAGLPPDAVPGMLERLPAMSPDTRSSLHYDLTHGKPLEIEDLSGAVVRLGAGAGLPAPIHRVITAALLPHHRAALRRRSGAPPTEH